MLTFGNKLNRSYTMYIPFMDDHCEITVFFNKSNSFVGHTIDQNNYNKSRNGDIKVFTFFDLSKSAFATSFLDLRCYKSKNLDIKDQFNNILPDFKDKIYYETNETCKLSKVATKKGYLESCLYIYVFKFIDLRNDFVYCLVERQHIDVALDRKVVRTSAIQISSNGAYEDVISLVDSSTRNIIKSESVDSIKDLFSDRKDVRD